MDTARADVIAPAKNEQLTTPSLESIASHGTRYDRAFASAPWTLPSHASLFTGTYPSQHGAHAAHKRLESTYLTIAEQLSWVDYETVAISNNTWISEEFGFERGFDTFHRTWQYVQSSTDLGRIARKYEGRAQLTALSRAIFEGNPLTNLLNATYGKFFRKRNDDGAQQTNEWIESWLADRDDSRPFFLFVNYLEPHLPYRPLSEFAERFLPSNVTFDEAMDVPQDAWGYVAGTVELSEYELEILRALYFAEIAYLDERIGDLRDRLVTAGEWDDTIFVVTGDHGENIGDHGLMDHQYCLYDTLLHVPLIIHGGPFTGGGTNDDLVQLTDIAPTLLDAAGIDAPEFREQTQGRSFHPDADTEPREYAFAEYMAPQPSIEALEKRVGTLPEEVYKYDRSLRSIRTKEWKLIRGSDGSRKLYYVEADPDESENLIDVEPEMGNELESELDSWLDSFEHADVDGDISMRDETKQRLEDLGYLQ